MNFKKVQTAIQQLPPEEVAALIAWLTEYRAQLWDQQLEADLDSGRLDAVLASANQEYRVGMFRPL